MGKICIFFNCAVGKENWKKLPWRIKFSLIAADVMAYAFIVTGVVILYRVVVLDEVLTITFGN